MLARLPLWGQLPWVWRGRDAGGASAPLLPPRVGWALWLPSSRQPWLGRRRRDQLPWRLALRRWAEGERQGAPAAKSKGKGKS